jgi:hypothetical protein
MPLRAAGERVGNASMNQNIHSRQMIQTDLSNGLPPHVGYNNDPEELLERNFQKYVQNYFYVDRYNESQLLQMLKFFEDENQLQSHYNSGSTQKPFH